MVTPIANFASEISTHRITLSDGTTTLGLILCDPKGNPIKEGIDEAANPVTALQVSNSGGGYDNYTQPYSPIPQVDWSGGLGIEYADQDMTRYLDGNACDTSLGKIIPAGSAGSSYNGPTESVSLAESSNWDALAAYYFSLTPGALALKRVDLYVKVTEPCTITWSFRVTNDVGGPGGTVDTIGVASGTWEFTAAEVGGAWKRVNVVATLAAATKYWFCLEAVTPSGTAAESLSYSASTGNSVTTSGGTVIHANSAYAHKLYANTQDGFRFFIYRGQIYAVTVSSDGSAVRLYQGGYRGAAASNAGRLMKYLVSGVSMPYSMGGAAVIIAGPGTREEQNYRSIIVGGGTSQEVSPPWRTTHTAATEYVVNNTGATGPPWLEVTGHGLTGPITDICIVDDRVYFCQGDAANIRRMVYTTAGGHAWTDEGAQADYMKMFTDTDGKKRIFMAVAASSMVYKCEVAVAMSTRTQVNNSLAVGSGDSWITNLAVYDDPQRAFVLKEDGFGSISNDVYGPIPISQAMKAVASRRNGRAVCANDRFLYFSMGPKLMRYYSGDLSNIGPDRDYGLPANRRGDIVDVVPYPGGVLYAAIDAGWDGYSSVLKHNGQGWCEIWRAPLGERVTNIIIQNIPGKAYQYLRVGCGDYIYTIPIAANPLQASGFYFAGTASLETGWYRTAYKDIVKFFNAVKLFLVPDNQLVTVYYRTEPGAAWTFLGSWGDDSGEEIEFNATNVVANDVTGTRIQLKIEMSQLSSSYPSGVEQLVLTTVTRIPTKKAWHITARVFDQSIDLRGKMDPRSAAEIKAVLEGWANSEHYAKRLLVQSSDFEVFHNKRVFIEPASLRPLRADAAGPRKAGYLVRLTLIEA